MAHQILFEFGNNSSIRDWNIVDDVVMGGSSQGTFLITPDGHGLFSGKISLENNGGFSSVRHEFSPILVNKEQKIRIRLKGDGKRYQFRVKHKSSDSVSYISYFETTGDWQKVEFRLGDLYPTFRGRKLNLPEFDHHIIEVIQFLVGNKKPESFRLLIDRIELIEE